MAGEMPGGKPCWFKVSSLERVLLLVLEGFQPRNTPQYQVALHLSWGPKFFLPKFPGGQPTTDWVPSLDNVLPAWLMLMPRPQHTISYRFPNSL